MYRNSILSSRRKAWLPLSFLFAFVIWYRSGRVKQAHGKYEVVDFRIRNNERQDATLDTNVGMQEALLEPHDTHYVSLAQGSKAEHLTYDQLQTKIRDYIQWDRPWTDHWPSWHDYDSANYDPNRWEGMDREYGYFYRNSVQELEHNGTAPEPYLPYPEYNSAAWRKKWHGQYVPCQGPRGETYGQGDSLDYVVRGYRSFAANFPNATQGSASLLGLDQNVCFDRYSRYAAYGLTDSHSLHGSHQRNHVAKHVHWENVRWGELQEACFEKNMDRFEPRTRFPMDLRPGRNMKFSGDPLEEANAKITTGGKGRQYRPRTAVLIRTWEGYNYQENDIEAIRALVTELSLLSGGEYQVFLFVNVKQREADIYDDPDVYQDVLRRTVPRELRDMAILWTERVCEDWYPDVGDWQVYWMQFMSLQWFSNQHPEFDYVWNWETDVRYIGNHYHFFEQVSAFAKGVPRKHLWERNSRFYFADQWNDDYQAFLDDTDEQILNASVSRTIDEPVWGPRPYAPFQTPLGPAPPTSQEEDNFEWGVGEEADLITLQPIWDPSETEWSYRNHIWNFIPGVRPKFTPENGNDDGFDHHGFPTIPRRVFINTCVRFSKRMLFVMHLENLESRSMQAEMWPATVALQHGLKAVYAPHPIWTDRVWPGWYADAVFNADDGFAARWSQQIDSPYNHDREANFGGWSWYYRSVFPSILFRRWLGWKAHDHGWDAEVAKRQEHSEKLSLAIRIEQDIVDLEDVRMCVPGILLHPVKNVHESADGG